MDLLIIILVALVLCWKNTTEPEIQEEIILHRETRLNPTYYVDENAFMEVAHALGFGLDTKYANSSDGDMWSESDDIVPSCSEEYVRSTGIWDSIQAIDSFDTRACRTRYMDDMESDNSTEHQRTDLSSLRYRDRD